MNENTKKMIRTLQTNFPLFLDAKFSAMRFYRNKLKIAFETDFNALSLFPDADGALYLDVGANRGQSTDAILLKTKNCLIQQFEPNQALCEKLTRQFSDNNDIILNRFGLGDRSEEQILYVPFYKEWMFDGLASFDEMEVRNWLENHILFFNEKNLSLRQLKCQTKTLDELNLKPFFIKLDIQGFEYRALRGAEQTLISYQPILLVETPSEKLINFLKNLGYEFYAFFDGKFFPGATGGQNTFFMTEAKAALVKKFIEPSNIN